MEKKVNLRFVYVIEGLVASGNVDTYFYSHLPRVETEVLDKLTQEPVTDIPPPEQAVTVRGSSAVSCSMLAEIINDYLRSRSRKTTITIEGPKKSVVYEGPGLQASKKDIEVTIGELTKDLDGDCLIIEAHFFA